MAWLVGYVGDETMQGLDVFILNPWVLLVAALILVVLVIVIGHKKGASGMRYWKISAIEVVFVFILWQLLSFPLWIVVMTYTQGSIEQRFQLVNIGNVLLYSGLFIFLLFIENRRGFTKKDSEKTVVINDT